MSKLRALVLLTLFFAITLPLIPVQALLLKVAPSWARRLPHWYHRQVCKLFGIKVRVTGAVDQARPVLLISNHTSWLDIPVLSSIVPVSFIAKKEVGSWPFVSWLARLQRSVFVDREKRSDVSRTTNAILDRLSAGDCIVLFAEGTSSDGNRVLDFRTSLFAAAKPPEKFQRDAGPVVSVQTAAIVYRRLHGVPLGRSGRKRLSWYGDMDMLSHGWWTLQAGPIDVDVVISAPQPLENFKDRKELARRTEDMVRAHVMKMLRGLDHDQDISIVKPVSSVGGQPSHDEAEPLGAAGKHKWR